MVAASLEPIRRRFFEAFYYTHHLFLVVFGLALWHSITVAGSLTGTLSFGLVLYGLDRVLRLKSSFVTYIPPNSLSDVALSALNSRVNIQ